MSGFDLFSCVNNKVPVSYSFHSLSVPAPSYNPGLASLTLRLYTGKSRRKSSESNDTAGAGGANAVVEGGGEIRLVHANRDICSIVQSSIDKFWPELKEESNEDKTEDEENFCFWSQMTGPTIHDCNTRAQFVLDLFQGLSTISWEIICSSNLTQSDSAPYPSSGKTADYGSGDVHEALTWLLKKQSVPIPGIDTVVIRIADTDDHTNDDVVEGDITNDDLAVYRVFAPGGKDNLEVNNILKSCLDNAAPPTTTKHKNTKQSDSDDDLNSKGEVVSTRMKITDGANKTNESGYISEEDKKSEDEADIIAASQLTTAVTGNADATSSATDTTADKQSEDLQGEKADVIGKQVEDSSTNEKEEKLKNIEENKDETIKTDVGETGQESIEITVESCDDTKTTSNDCKDELKDNENQTKDKTTSGEDPESQSGVVLRNKVLIEKLFSSSGGQGEGIVHHNKRIPTPTSFRESQDDPCCPCEFKSAGSMHQILIDLAYRMFARQWKLASSTRLDKCGETLLLFAHDSRILPGIGQQTLAGVCAHQRASGVSEVSLVNMENSVVDSLCEKLKLKKSEGKENVYTPEDGDWFLSKLVFSMSQESFSWYRGVETKSGFVSMFRMNNLDQARGLTLHLTRGNIIRLLDANQADVQIIRDVISTRWPYPIQDDHRINYIDSNACGQLDKSGGESSAPKDKSRADDNKEKGAMDEETVEIDLKGEQDDQIMDWEWRVRRYPWRVSYGAKLVDRTARRVARLVNLPAPRHHDLESAKSLVIFCIKELSQQEGGGWRFVGGINYNQGSYLQFIK